MVARPQPPDATGCESGVIFPSRELQMAKKPYRSFWGALSLTMQGLEDLFFNIYIYAGILSLYMDMIADKS
ncbi:hypothetical protein llap_9385 [Limosa lapponica baueri]|uniref:Uncharacterized protein n=1 Tax=Limosa lapponica baueri TaxID=1758121 RepID=A0A2I0U2X8_LIMLA|nr:hypothetical protein llap_9385 [Limosa lapponica baueri]